MTAVQSTAGGAAVSRGSLEVPPLLKVEDLYVEFRLRNGTVNAVNGASYSLRDGETLAILGESGSGKSVSTQAVLGLVEKPDGYITSGAVTYRGDDLLGMNEVDLNKIRGEEIAIIYQSASLNPSFSVGWQIAEMFRVHRRASRREASAQAIGLLDRVGIPAAARRARDYPHQFSGGMRQRVAIAMAIALDPQLLIADEPTTALDVTVQAQILELLAELQAERNMGMILITHDLGVVAEVADSLAVMYAGRVVEAGPAREVLASPDHPYTAALMRSLPEAANPGARLNAIIGSPPDLMHLPSGCSFQRRCPEAQEICRTDAPPTLRMSPNRTSACHLLAEVPDAR